MDPRDQCRCFGKGARNKVRKFCDRESVHVLHRLSSRAGRLRFDSLKRFQSDIKKSSERSRQLFTIKIVWTHLYLKVIAFIQRSDRRTIIATHKELFEQPVHVSTHVVLTKKLRRFQDANGRSGAGHRTGLWKRKQR